MLNGVGLSDPDLLDWLEPEYCRDGRRCSGAVFPAEVLGWAGVVDDPADVKGADRVFLTFENSDDTRAYEDWSCSSSSENGLKDVRLVTSSTNLVLLRDLEEGALPGGQTEVLSAVSVMGIQRKKGIWVIAVVKMKGWSGGGAQGHSE